MSILEEGQQDSGAITVKTMLEFSLKLLQWASEIATAQSFWYLVFIAQICFAWYYIVMPYFEYIGRHIKAFCKPVGFAYQHVVVTGGGTGLGRALAQGFFFRGAIVTIIGKDEQKLEQLRSEL